MSATLKLSGALRVGILDADPSNAEAGLIYFNTTSGQYRMFENGNFRTISAENLEAHLTDDANLKHDDDEIDYTRADGSRKNIAANATSPNVALAINNLDDAVGALEATPTNYSPTDASIVADHLAAIDAALATAGATTFDDAEFRIEDTGGDGFGITTDVSAATADRVLTFPDSNVDLGDIADIADIRTTQGTSDGDTNLGTFTGTTISDNTTVKNALQELETSTETKANNTLSNLDSPTAVNQSLLPDTADIRSIGDATSRWANIFQFSSRYYNTSTTLEGEIVPGGSGFSIKTPNKSGATSNSLDLLTGNGTSGGNSGGINLTTGDSNDNSGDISLQTGTAAGTRGKAVINALELDMSNSKIVSLATPTNDADAATKAYVDAVVVGVTDTKLSVRAASTANIDLATGGLLTIDGVSLNSGDRVLVKDQTTASENGIYEAAAGAWSRSSDADENDEVTGGMYMWVNEGTTQADSGWLLTTDDPITLDTDPLTFTQFSGLGQVTAGDGLTKTGNTLDVGAGDGINVAADSVAVDNTVVRSDGSVAFAANQSMGSNKLTSLADGTLAGDAVNKSQLDTKISAVVEDTTPQLGGNLDTNGNAILHDTDGVKRGNTASPSDLVEEEYIHAISLSASQTGTVITELTFAHATYEGMEVVYKVKEATSGDIRIGTLRVVTNGTDVVLNDVSTETADTGILFSAAINGANVEISYDSGTNGATMRADVKRILA